MEYGDLISRQAAIDELNEYFARIEKLKRKGLTKGEKAISLDTVGAIKTLPSAQQWIPCDTNEPDTIGDYLLYRPHFWGASKGQVTVCYWNGRDWSDNYRNDAERYLPVIFGMAWMPLPEPWKGGETK